jgi:nucleoside-diphosphate-sugar epimerase
MKRVLVTGASGFVGANLARRLHGDGHELHLLLRDPSRAWRIEDFADSVAVHVADIADRAAAIRVVRSIRPDWVFNLAAHGAYSSQTDFGLMVAANVTGCVALLDACVETGVEAFVHTGSSSEYGRKDHAGREDEPLQPESRYAITKAAATHCCQLAARQHGINAITLRLYSIYGPFEEPSRLIPALIAYGSRNRLPPLVSRRSAHDFVHVHDAVEALLRAASMKAPAPGAVFNICSGIQHDLESVVECARRLMNIDAEPVWSQMPGRPWDTDVWVGSPSLFKKVSGWQCTIGFEAGLRQTIEWFADSPPALRDRYFASIFE